MSVLFILSLLFYFFGGNSFAVSYCKNDDCFRALKKQHPAIVRNHCASILPSKTVTIYNKRGGLFTTSSTIFTTTTLTERFGPCSASAIILGAGEETKIHRRDAEASVEGSDPPVYGGNFGHGGGDGYNDDGYNDGGYNDGGYNDGGYNDGGYNDGGYNDGGYNDGGYNDDGYNDGGYNDDGSDEGYGRYGTPHKVHIPSYACDDCEESAYIRACSCLFDPTTVTVAPARSTTVVHKTNTHYEYILLPNTCSPTASSAFWRNSTSRGPSSSTAHITFLGTISKLPIARPSTRSVHNSSSSSIGTGSLSRSTIFPPLTTGPSISASTSSRPAPPNITSSTSVVASHNVTSSSSIKSSSSTTTSSAPTKSTSTPWVSSNVTYCTTNEVVDLQTDPKHCGACNNTCSTREKCVNGICSTPFCDGKVCGSFTPCGTGGPTNGCSCYSIQGRSGFCMEDQFCNDLQDCSTSDDCGSGSICAVGTCCQRNVCMPAVCPNPSSGFSKLAKRVALGGRIVGEMTTNGQLFDASGRTNEWVDA